MSLPSEIPMPEWHVSKDSDRLFYVDSPGLRPSFAFSTGSEAKLFASFLAYTYYDASLAFHMVLAVKDVIGPMPSAKSVLLTDILPWLREQLGNREDAKEKLCREGWCHVVTPDGERWDSPDLPTEERFIFDSLKNAMLFRACLTYTQCPKIAMQAYTVARSQEQFSRTLHVIEPLPFREDCADPRFNTAGDEESSRTPAAGPSDTSTPGEFFKPCKRPRTASFDNISISTVASLDISAISSFSGTEMQCSSNRFTLLPPLVDKKFRSSIQENVLYSTLLDQIMELQASKKQGKGKNIDQLRKRRASADRSLFIFFDVFAKQADRFGKNSESFLHFFGGAKKNESSRQGTVLHLLGKILAHPSTWSEEEFQVFSDLRLNPTQVKWNEGFWDFPWYCSRKDLFKGPHINPASRTKCIICNSNRKCIFACKSKKGTTVFCSRKNQQGSFYCREDHEKLEKSGCDPTDIEHVKKHLLMFWTEARILPVVT